MSSVFNSFNTNTPPRSTFPAVSVIIPLYNTEKYIGACLESILNQTFQNFEVIIVDDCSTDNSVAIVESYREKFGGRLTLSHMEKNSGSGVIPRNKGLNLSRGEYIFNMDNDDMLTKTALEELYMLAKNFDADVVYCEKRFEVNSDGTNLRVNYNQNGNSNFIDKPTFESENLAERVQKVSHEAYGRASWTKLVRRNLLIENELFFPQCAIADDTIWSLGLAFYAKKFLRVPNIVYIYRMVEDSLSHKKRTPEQTINFWFDPLLLGLKTLDKWLGKLEFFRQNPPYQYFVLEFFFRAHFYGSFQAALQLPPFAVYETIKQAFGQRCGDNDVLISMLSASLNTLQKIHMVNVQKFNQFAAQAQQRIAQLESEFGKKT